MNCRLSDRVFVAGHKGMVGSAIVHELQNKGYETIVLRSRDELDLLDQNGVVSFFKNEKIDQVYLAAARVGGIHANNAYPAEFIYQNLMIQANVINAAHLADVNRLLFLGSSCIYPKYAQQPMKEEALLSGYLEPTNEPYAIAKIAGIKLCESYNRQYSRDYRSVMPTNLYGPNDNFHPENSHVIPGLLYRFHQAVLSKSSELLIWGTGNPRREFLYVNDMASASVYVMELDPKIYINYTQPMLSHINVGSGIDYSIRELVEMIAEETSFQGLIRYDINKSDGPPKKLLDVSRLKSLGWTPSVSLRDGLRLAYHWYLENYPAVR